MKFLLKAASILLALTLLLGTYQSVSAKNLKKRITVKKQVTKAPKDVDRIVIKFKDDVETVTVGEKGVLNKTTKFDKLNRILKDKSKTEKIEKRIKIDNEILESYRIKGSARSGINLPKLKHYHTISIKSSLTESERIDYLNSLLDLDIIENAFFEAKPDIAAFENDDSSEKDENTQMKSAALDWQPNQYYLNPAPQGVDAYYSWQFPGGKGESVKVIDIEGNWIETHEDLKGGTTNFHIAGTRLNEASWWNHGTAVLGEIAADSNGFGMTGISFNVDLGTVSIGSMSTASALTTAMNNSDTGDVILIELHAPGPHYGFESRDDQQGYVAMEFWDDTFDAILTASANGRIIVEAAGNGRENFDDVSLYGQKFDPEFRFSGAIMVGAACSNHSPASFTNYGQRVDVHGFGCWDVFTLGYGDLYGNSVSNHYTADFAGTSSSSPIIVGAAACLQGVNKAAYQKVLDHSEIRELFLQYSTPQTGTKHIGPLPDLQGAIDQITGVVFYADTTIGWVPFDVSFDATSTLNVNNWNWNFGDGNFGFIEDPTHTFSQSGVYDVSLEVETDDETRSTIRGSYIVALADSMLVNSEIGNPDSTVVLNIYAQNTIPLKKMVIPFEYPGNLRIKYDSVSTVGCRTEYFEEATLAHYDSFNRRLTIQLRSAVTESHPDLAPGSGIVAKIYMTIHATAEPGETASIDLDGYLDYTPRFDGSLANYDVISNSGLIEVEYAGCCLGIRGNFNGDEADELDISDLVAFIDYMFGEAGGEPDCPEEADVDSNESIDVSDIVFLIDYFFNSGDDPLSCH